MYRGFDEDVKKFNSMYRLAPVDLSTRDGVEHIGRWVDILHEEVSEGYEAHNALVNDLYGGDMLAAKTEIADWLGDMLIYCCTEAARLDIPLGEVVRAIMQSNFTKLGPDGSPIHDERGKVMKGHSFQPPEPAIRKILEAHTQAGVTAAPTGASVDLQEGDRKCRP